MISIIIPLYNESDNIKFYGNDLINVTTNICNYYNEKVEYIFVNDGSVDDTVEALHNHLGTCDIRIIEHKKNMGLGCALRTGISKANGDKIITIDADLTYSPRDIDKLLDRYYRTGADCISGSPYLSGGYMEDVPFYRIFLSKCVNLLCKIVLWRNVSCVSGIFRLYKKSVFDDMDLVSKNFEINAEILSKMLIANKTVVEIPVSLTKRKYGVSKININKEIMNYLVLFYRIIKNKYLGMRWD